MSVTFTYTSGGNEVVIKTERGVAAPGETVPETETAKEWKARHKLRIAESQDPDVFPPDP